MGDRSRVRVAFAPFHYLINHPGQLSLAIPPWVGKMSIVDGTTTAGEENSEFCVTVGPVIRTAGIVGYGLLSELAIRQTWGGIMLT